MNITKPSMTFIGKSGLLSGLVIATLGFSLIWFSQSTGNNGWLADDQFYYFEIAKNLASGKGFTFDELSPTTGFNLLWLLIITPVWFFGPDLPLELQAKLALSLSAVFFAASANLAHAVIRDRFGDSKSFVIVATSFGLGVPLVVNGLETALLCFLIFCLAWSVSEGSKAGVGFLPLASFLLPLARFDSVIFLFLLVALGRLVHFRWRQLVVVGGAGFLGLVSVLAFNLALSSHPISSAGRIKSWWGSQGIAAGHDFDASHTVHALTLPIRYLFEATFGLSPLPAAILGLVVFGILGVLFRKRFVCSAVLVLLRTGPIAVVFFGLVAYPIVLIFLLSFRQQGIWPWYVALLPAGLFYIVGVLVSANSSPSSIAFKAAVLSSFLMPSLLAGTTIWGTHADRGALREVKVISEWAASNLDASDVLGVWAAGQVGYMAEDYRVANLEGLVTGPSAVDAIVEGRREALLESLQITALCGWFEPDVFSSTSWETNSFQRLRVELLESALAGNQFSKVFEFSFSEESLVVQCFVRN